MKHKSSANFFGIGPMAEHLNEISKFGSNMYISHAILEILQKQKNLEELYLTALALVHLHHKKKRHTRGLRTVSRSITHQALLTAEGHTDSQINNSNFSRGLWYSRSRYDSRARCGVVLLV